MARPADTAANSIPQQLQQSLLRRSETLARAASASGNPARGALLADRTGYVLVEAIDTTLTDDDTTAHPESKLATWAARWLGPATLADVLIVSSCEPCTACVDAIDTSGITTVLTPPPATASADPIASPSGNGT